MYRTPTIVLNLNGNKPRPQRKISDQFPRQGVLDKVGSATIVLFVFHGLDLEIVLKTGGIVCRLEICNQILIFRTVE